MSRLSVLGGLLMAGLTWWLMLLLLGLAGCGADPITTTRVCTDRPVGALEESRCE